MGERLRFVDGDTVEKVQTSWYSDDRVDELSWEIKKAGFFGAEITIGNETYYVRYVGPSYISRIETGRRKHGEIVSPNIAYYPY